MLQRISTALTLKTQIVMTFKIKRFTIGNFFEFYVQTFYLRLTYAYIAYRFDQDLL